MFGEAQPTQYQRADREYDEEEQRELENQRLKYVVGEQCMSFIDHIHSIFSLDVSFFSESSRKTW